MASDKEMIPFGVDDPRVVAAWNSLPNCCRGCVVGPILPSLGGVAVAIRRRKDGATSPEQSNFVAQDVARDLEAFGNLFREAEKMGKTSPCSEGKTSLDEKCPLADLFRGLIATANYGFDKSGPDTLAYTNFSNRDGVGFRPTSED